MDYKEKAEMWLKYPYLDRKLKIEIEKMNDDELKEAFTDDLEFGTGGLRGILGAGSNRMNIYVVRRATKGFGEYLIKNTKKALERGVVISFDNRHMSKEFSLEAANVLTKMGFKIVFLYHDLRPTPQLSWTVRHLKACGGIMITASHNPKDYNGYKVYNELGCQLNLDEAGEVIKNINAITDIFSVKTETKRNPKIHYLYDEYDDVYLDDIKTISINPDLPKDFKITYTPLHGTGGEIIPRFLTDLGYDVTPVESQMVHDPDFGAVESSNPENKEAFTKSLELAKNIGAKLVLATDPDADRLGVGVLHNGEYVLLTGNESASVLFRYICQEKSKDPKWVKKNKYLFSTIVSSSLPLEIAKKYNVNTVLTLTGFKFIGEQCEKIKGKGEFAFGFEESYGCLIKDSVRDKDSAQACLMLCEACAFYLNEGKTLVDVLNEIYEEYGYYKDGISNIALKGLEGKAKINEIMDYFRNNEIKLEGYNIIHIEDYKESVGYDYPNGKKEKLTLPKSNVLKFYLDNNNWFVLRPSGTEPKLKVYYEVVNKSEEETLNTLEDLKSKVLDIVNNI